MSKQNGSQPEARRFDSPLAQWPGHFTLKNPNEFTGKDWNNWRKAVEAMPGDTDNRVFCYAGIALIEAIGSWQMEIPIAEVKGWRSNPDDERIKLVSWLGKQIENYIRELVNPLE